MNFFKKDKKNKAKRFEWIHCVEFFRGNRTLDSLEIEFIRYAASRLGNSHSQLGQDIFVDFILQKPDGVFCEFGATDGRSLSNSYYLENQLGWSGILAEPARSWQRELQTNRPDAQIDFRCVYNESGKSIIFNEVQEGELSTIERFSSSDHFGKKRSSGKRYDVETITLNDLLDFYNVERLDYLSVDTEGSEYLILEKFDFSRFAPKVITVEHNFCDYRAKLYELLTKNGYTRVCETISMFDDWYILPSSASEEVQDMHLSKLLD